MAQRMVTQKESDQFLSNFIIGMTKEVAQKDWQGLAESLCMLGLPFEGEGEEDDKSVWQDSDAANKVAAALLGTGRETVAELIKIFEHDLTTNYVSPTGEPLEGYGEIVRHAYGKAVLKWLQSL